MAALARLDFDLRKTLALKMTLKRGNNFIYFCANDVTKLAIRTRHARNGVDRPLRCACVKGQNLKTVPAEHPFGRRQIWFAPVAVNPWTLGPLSTSTPAKVCRTDAGKVVATPVLGSRRARR